MPYIGNIPTTAFTSLAKQDITGNGGTIYTLDHEVSSPNDIAVFLNNVRQEPTEAYSVSGTTLTMTGAIQSSDNFYVIFIAKAIQTTVPPDGSVSTSKIVNDAVTTLKILDSSVTSAKTNFMSSSSNAGLEIKGDGSSVDGYLQLNCHVNTHGVKLKAPPHSAQQSYTLTLPSTAPSAGKALITDGNGVLSFGDAGVASEEGSWTPSLTGVSSPSVAVGRYVKIGKVVTAHANVNGVVSGSGSMTVSGLPYASNSTTNMQQSITVGFNSHVYYSSGSMQGVQARINPGSSAFSLLRYRHGNNGDGVQASQQSGTAVTILIGGTYITD
tara:strand:- start:14039 stop:15019 length:981 start_codon:yes stop_codon:yes gene_type:complete